MDIAHLLILVFGFILEDREHSIKTTLVVSVEQPFVYIMQL